MDSARIIASLSLLESMQIVSSGNCNLLKESPTDCTIFYCSIADHLKYASVRFELTSVKIVNNKPYTIGYTLNSTYLTLSVNVDFWNLEIRTHFLIVVIFFDCLLCLGGDHIVVFSDFSFLCNLITQGCMRMFIILF